MGKVIVDMSVTLDGFISGPNDGLKYPLGVGGERIHEWKFNLAVWRAPQGLRGGKTTDDSEIIDETSKNIGATIVGKRMYWTAQGWGDEPPFHQPVFVLTHEARPPEPKQGGTTFYFVTDGIESALRQAKAAAGDKDVSVGGGANTVQQFLKAGLIDEMQLHVAPVLFGSGTRLFENLGDRNIEMEIVRVAESDRVTHLKYRFVK